MEFILKQLQQLGMVALVMACALDGTVGLIKMIEKLSGGPDSAAQGGGGQGDRP